jgi:integrase
MIAECLTAYATRPGGLKRYDIARLLDLNKFTGIFPIGQAAIAWSAWVANRGAGQKPTSIQRWRNTFQAALNHGAAAHGTTAPKLPAVKGGAGVERAIYLTDDERRRLLAAYNPHAACPVLLLAYQGMRTQEALQLDWRRVNFDARTIFLPADETKAEKARTVPMHPRVDALLFGMWCACGRPVSGSVFLSAKGRPYADTRGRGSRAQGGNPLAQAHDTACARAGITGFRVHDLRHDWAHRMVMSGCDLRTLMDLGGWSSLRMVQRYAAGSPSVAVEAIGRLR